MLVRYSNIASSLVIYLNFENTILVFTYFFWYLNCQAIIVYVYTSDFYNNKKKKNISQILFDKFILNTFIPEYLRLFSFYHCTLMTNSFYKMYFVGLSTYIHNEIIVLYWFWTKIKCFFKTKYVFKYFWKVCRLPNFFYQDFFPRSLSYIDY